MHSLLVLLRGESWGDGAWKGKGPPVPWLPEKSSKPLTERSSCGQPVGRRESLTKW